MKKIFLLALFSILLLTACNTQDKNLSSSGNQDLESEEIEIYPDKERFMKEYGISLTAKDVQYDMRNNLENFFYVEGILEICDYYNYGFTDESRVFCGKVTPHNGSYSESWYLYFARDTFHEVFEELKVRDLNVMIEAKIFSKRYREGQGNMALVRTVEYR